MRLHRFYVSQPLGEDVVIKDVSVIKQWSKVFRYKEGDFVILFNGNGYDYQYSIQSITSSQSTLQYIEKSPSYIPKKKVTLYLSLIKKDNFELVVQKATELGVSTIVPIVSERSEKKNLNMERLHKVAIESSEQCFRGDVPTISPISTLSDALGIVSDSTSSYVLQMDGIKSTDVKFQNSLKQSESINFFVGPEGGWSDHELEIFSKHKITSISLGNTVLRAETAGIITCVLPTLL